MTVHLYFVGSGVIRNYAQAIIQASSGDQDFMQDGTIEVYDFGACIVRDGAERVVPWSAVREVRLSSEKPSYSLRLHRSRVPPPAARGCRLTLLSPQSLSASPDTPG